MIIKFEAKMDHGDMTEAVVKKMCKMNMSVCLVESWNPISKLIE